MRNFSIILIGLLCTSVNEPEQRLYEIERLPIEQIKIEHKTEIKPKSINENLQHCDTKKKQTPKTMLFQDYPSGLNIWQKSKIDVLQRFMLPGYGVPLIHDHKAKGNATQVGL